MHSVLSGVSAQASTTLWSSVLPVKHVIEVFVGLKLGDGFAEGEVLGLIDGFAEGEGDGQISTLQKFLNSPLSYFGFDL